MKKELQRFPSYTEAIKTIKRSIQARGGIAQEERVLEALVWNYYTHMPYVERKKIGLQQPYSWDASGWIEFKRRLSKEESLFALVKQAKDHLWYAVAVESIVKVVFILNKDNKQTKMLVLPDTKITIGA